MSTRLLGIQIANGYSPEARVFANLLGQRAEGYYPHVFHHSWAGDTQSPAKFEATARAPLTPFDTGWRPNPSGRRSPLAKIASHIQFRLTLPKMFSAARVFNPDVIYSCQQHWDCLAATYIARRLHKPQIIHLHYTVGEWLHKPVLQRLLTTDHVVTVSDFIRREALKHGVPPERVTTIHNTVDTDALPSQSIRADVRAEIGVPQNAPLVGIVGRLDPGKGQDDTITAFAKIATQFPDTHLIIVGDGSRRDMLEVQAAQTGLGKRILFLGRRSDVPRLLPALDIFMHPSRHEPFGLAVAEASAAGLPVVAYAEGGIAEIIVDRVTGTLAAPSDVNALSRLLTGHPGKAGFSLSDGGKRSETHEE